MQKRTKRLQSSVNTRVLPKLWVHDHLLVPLKMWGGAKALLKGNTRGWYTNAHFRRLLDEAQYRLPDSVAFLSKYYDKDVIGKRMATRFSYCMSSEDHPDGKDELLPLLGKSYEATQRAVFETEDRLTKQRLAELQEEYVKRSKPPKTPGVYFRTDPELNRRIRIGYTGDIATRDHSSGFHYLMEFIVIPNKGRALAVEEALIQFYRGISKPEWRNSRGKFEVESGDALQLGLEYVRVTFPSLFYNRNKLILVD